MPDPASAGELIDAYFKLREERRELNEQIRSINQDLEALKLAIIEKLDDSKLDMGRGHLATAAIQERVVPTLKDFESFERFVYRHKALHLMETRISAKAFREMLEERGEVPGVEPFTRRDLSVTVRRK